MKKIIISVLLFLIAFYLQVVTLGGPLAISTFFYAPSLCFLLFMIAFFIILTDSYKYFINGFKLVFTKNIAFSKNELKHMGNTYSTLIRITIFLVILENIMIIIKMLSVLQDLTAIAPLATLGLLAVFYGMIICLFFTIINYKIKDVMLE